MHKSRIFFVVIIAAFTNMCYAQSSSNTKVLLDRWYNNEYKVGQRFHYTWDDMADTGFSTLGSLFKEKGATLHNLDEAPTYKSLKSFDVYIIVDPDNKKDSPTPNFISDKASKEIIKWVKKGGSLVIMGNDTTNACVPQLNKITQAFGIKLTDRNINSVKADIFEQGVVYTAVNEVFTKNHKLFVKDASALEVKSPAIVLASNDQGNIIAASKLGKGKIFVIGDPWIYNEYIVNNRLPNTFQNTDATRDLINWLITKNK
jgi:unsaturated rhamnogalacturonyl hydrolase